MPNYVFVKRADIKKVQHHSWQELVAEAEAHPDMFTTSDTSEALQGWASFRQADGHPTVAILHRQNW